jgi:hypothetical protein
MVHLLDVLEHVLKIRLSPKYRCDLRFHRSSTKCLRQALTDRLGVLFGLVHGASFLVCLGVLVVYYCYYCCLAFISFARRFDCSRIVSNTLSSSIIGFVKFWLEMTNCSTGIYNALLFDLSHEPEHVAYLILY